MSVLQSQTQQPTVASEVVPNHRWVALTARLARLPGWAQALLIMMACQLLTALLLDRAARFTLLDHEGHTSRWSYLAFVARWDSAWYRKIAEGGYPSVLPIDAAGQVRTQVITLDGIAAAATEFDAIVRETVNHQAADGGPAGRHV